MSEEHRKSFITIETKGILSLSERGHAAGRRKGRQLHGEILL